MSVPEGKRTKSKFEVLTRVREMASYTVQACSNDKIFPKRERWTVANRIVSVALEIMEQTDFANSIYVSVPSDYALRRTAQTTAVANTASLLGLINLAYVRYNIEGRKIAYWTSLVLEVRELLIAWRRADSDRYGKIGG